jgi:hypothetical protein
MFEGMTSRQEVPISLFSSSRFINQPATLVDVIAQYVAEERDRYDFQDDGSGEVQWYRVAREMPSKHKLELTLPPEPTAEDVFAVVVRICEHFAKLIQDNQLCNLLYDKSGERTKVPPNCSSLA